jgi:hypothetical protein
MKDGRPNSAGEPEGKRPAPAGRKGSGGLGRRRNFVDRAMAQGHSGHGAESVRPYLRDQLKLKSLLPQPYPTPEPEFPKKDEHHR